MRRSTVLSLPPQLVFPATVVKFYSIGPKKQMTELIVEKKIFLSLLDNKAQSCKFSYNFEW
jgi:hypothetical protein